MSTGALRLAGTLVIALLLMAASGAAASRWQANSYGKRLADQARLHQEDLTTITIAAANQTRRAVEKLQEAEQALAVIDTKAYKEKAHDLAENERLRAAIAVADHRLRITGRCSTSSGNLPSSAGAAGMDDGAAIELAPFAGRSVFDIRAGIIADQAALKALQGYVRTVCGIK